MIHFNYEDTDWRLDLETETTQWIDLITQHHGFQIFEINYVFCSDDYLLYLNQKYLSHDDYTDILTFDYTTEGTKQLVIDLFISIDRVRENAHNLHVPFIDELHRVMIHGVLHTMGYNDETETERQTMRHQEDYALSLRMF